MSEMTKERLDGLREASASKLWCGPSYVPQLIAEIDRLTRIMDKLPKAESGAAMIVAERKRQVEVESWDSSHDSTHIATALACAGICYASIGSQFFTDIFPRMWPWDDEWWKPTGTVRNLAKAGALIAAEIDRTLAARDHEAGKEKSCKE
jgi:hypothetical protein